MGLHNQAHASNSLYGIGAEEESRQSSHYSFSEGAEREKHKKKKEKKKKKNKDKDKDKDKEKDKEKKKHKHHKVVWMNPSLNYLIISILKHWLCLIYL